MAKRVRAGDLLRAASELYDAPSSPLARSAPAAWRRGFASGAEWMGQALWLLRGTQPVGNALGLQALGLIKYGLACGGALAFVALAILVHQSLIVLLCIPAFYVIEAQMVFLFPLALDGDLRVFRSARHWPVHARGTLSVIRIVSLRAVTSSLGG